jgi:hypothetical protein
MKRLALRIATRAARPHVGDDRAPPLDLGRERGRSIEQRGKAGVVGAQREERHRGGLPAAFAGARLRRQSSRSDE